MLCNCRGTSINWEQISIILMHIYNPRNIGGSLIFVAGFECNYSLFVMFVSKKGSFQINMLSEDNILF